MIARIKKYIKEIRTVGFLDWIWFVIWLERDEFSHHLSFYNYHKRGKMHLLVRDRSRAHCIDNRLAGLNK